MVTDHSIFGRLIVRKFALLTALGTILFPVLHAAPAQALIPKTWVASNGIDNAACGPRPTPCKTFQFALGQTSPGGEIGVVDSGDYGPVIINKSISIIAEGAEAGILVTGGTAGILISTGATDVVHLRGLIIDGGGLGIAGIQVAATSPIRAVHIEKCVIKNFTGATLASLGSYGIVFNPGVTSELYVSDTVIINNGNLGLPFGGGIWIVPAVASVRLRVVLNRVEVNNNLSGINADGSTGPGSIANINVRDSVTAGNNTFGIWAKTPNPNGGTISMILDRVSSASNRDGVVSDGANSFLRITNSTVTGNGNGLSFANGGTLESFGNNNVIGNAVDGMPSTVAGQR
jgi:hypothetical protein